MKKIVSLALLVSTPLGAMERYEQTNPIPAAAQIAALQESGKREAWHREQEALGAEAFQIKADEFANTLPPEELLLNEGLLPGFQLGPIPTNFYGDLLKDMEARAPKTNEPTLLAAKAPTLEMAKPTPIHDSTDNTPAPESFIARHMAKGEELSNFLAEGEKKLQARAANLVRHIQENKLADKLAKAAEAGAKKIFTQSMQDSIELKEQLDTKLSKVIAMDPLTKRTQAAIAHLENLPEGEPLKINPNATDKERLDAIIKHYKLEDIIAAGTTPEEDKGYESETEIGLSPDNIKVYRFSKKYVDPVTQTLVKAHPHLKAWFANPKNESCLKQLPIFTAKLIKQTNRLEIWLAQEGYHLKQTTAFQRLRLALSGLKETMNTISEEHENFLEELGANISHPATQFLTTADSLEKLIKR